MRDLRNIAARDYSGLAHLFGIDDAIAIAGIGASLLGSNKASKAAKEAADQSRYATDQSNQLARDALATQQANTATARAAGDQSITTIANELGVNPNAAAPNEAAQLQAYMQQWPDVAQAWDQVKGDPRYGGDVLNWAKSHYETYGKAEGRQLPPAPATAQTGTAGASGVPAFTRPQEAPAPQVMPRQDFARPADQQAPTASARPTFERPAETQRQTYSRTDMAPLDVGMGAFRDSGEYAAAEYDIGRQSGATTAALAATGGLQSGAALKRLQEIGQDNKVKYYGQFRGATTDQYNTDRNRSDNIFSQDRAYGATNFENDRARSDNMFAADRAYGNTNYENDRQSATDAYRYSQNRADGNFADDRDFGTATYDADRNFGQGVYESNRARTDSLFNQDRGYGTDLAMSNRDFTAGQTQQRTNNLFNLANIGQGAVGQSNAAAQNYATNGSNAAFSNAANQGNAALTGANIFNGTLASGANALALYYGNRKNATGTSTYNPLNGA